MKPTMQTTFIATVYKVQTLVDGGIRVTLDLPETAIKEMAFLADCHRNGENLRITVETDEKPKRR